VTTETTGNARLLSAGALLSAVAASVCCIGPVALALLGLGGGALLLKFEPYRPYLLAATALFLGAAFYLTYRRPAGQDCPSDSACPSAASRKGQKIALWIVTLIVMLASTFPYFSKWLF
jgi:mercuric ion transport protein